MGGSGSYVLGSSNLPAWLSFNAGTRVLSAVSPPTAGVFTVNITLQDASGGPTFTYGYSLTVNAFAITDNGVLPQAAIGTPYTHTFSAPGCVGCVWTSNALPAGFSLSGAGVLTGTNTSMTGFNANFTVTATGSNGTVSKIFAFIEPSDIEPLTITTSITTTTRRPAACPPPELNASGGTPPHTFSVLASGTLPAGVTLQSPGETSGVCARSRRILPRGPPSGSQYIQFYDSGYGCGFAHGHQGVHVGHIADESAVHEPAGRGHDAYQRDRDSGPGPAASGGRRGQQLSLMERPLPGRWSIPA